MFSSSKMAVLGSGVLNQTICSFASKHSINLTCLDVNKANVVNYEALKYDDKLRALIFDACELDLQEGLDVLYKFFNLYSSMIKECGRVIILSSDKNPVLDAALSGFMKSLSKELGAIGVCVNKLLIREKVLSENLDLEDILAFMCSDKAAYITGQTIVINNSAEPTAFKKPLEGKLAL